VRQSSARAALRLVRRDGMQWRPEELDPGSTCRVRLAEQVDTRAVESAFFLPPGGPLRVRGIRNTRHGLPRHQVDVVGPGETDYQDWLRPGRACAASRDSASSGVRLRQSAAPYGYALWLLRAPMVTSRLTPSTER